MSDLIERQNAIDAVDVKNLHRGIVEALQEIIKELPSAEPGRKIGKWIVQDWNLESGLRRTIHSLPKCSICGFNAYHEYRYCPNCGSRMEDQSCRE